MDNNLIFIFFLLGGTVLHNLVSLYFNNKYYKNFQNIPPLHLPLEGMFVRIEGRVTLQQRIISPLSRNSCAFYQLKAKGEYHFKRKAPSRGYEKVTKNLYTELSEERVLIDNKNQIFIEIEKGKDVILKINKVEKEQREPLTDYPSHNRATKYLYEEKYLKNGDRVVVFGRLVKKDNSYIVTHTYSKKLPFMIYLDNTSELESDYKKKININLFFMLLSLGVLAYRLI